MKKRYAALLLALLTGVWCSACGQRAVKPMPSPPAAVSETTAPAPAPSPVPVPSEAPPESESTVPTPSPEPQAETGVDVDLTVGSSTVVYAEAYSILLSPEAYVGKTIRVRGQFVFHEEPQTGIRHFACVIPDNTACCVQSFEFVPADPDAYPDGYPEPNVGEEITVVGTIDTYEENGMPYAWITQATVESPAL